MVRKRKPLKKQKSVVNLFVIVISLWGYTGTDWVYVGNQIVLNHPVSKEECEIIRNNWSWHEKNEFYRFSIECIEHKKE